MVSESNWRNQTRGRGQYGMSETVSRRAGAPGRTVLCVVILEADNSLPAPLSGRFYRGSTDTGYQRYHWSNEEGSCLDMIPRFRKIVGSGAWAAICTPTLKDMPIPGILNAM